MIAFNNIKIISGGQTGVDRAALDFAIVNKMQCGGWCPKGRKAEDRPIPIKYPLTEMTSREYRLRTQKNVNESDGTLIIYCDEFDLGTSLTLSLCKKHNKPCLVLKTNESPDHYTIMKWIAENEIHILNIAGPRESFSPGIYQKTLGILRTLLE